MYTILSSGIFQEVTLPCYGKQDLGISPDGCMDRFSYAAGNILLGNPPEHPALEIILPPKIAFSIPVFFVLTGAPHDSVILTTANNNESSGNTIEHGRVYFCPAGAALSFGAKIYGFRTYLCWRAADSISRNQSPEGHFRGEFQTIACWPDPEGYIRVLPGPEYGYVENPEYFYTQAWEIAADSNQMGLRLIHKRQPLRIQMGNMISAPVSDGTVQLTPKGPIVLLRHRQTIGGYPRVFNVISADVDLLAQYMPGQLVRFKTVEIDEAYDIAHRRSKDLAAITRRWGGYTL